MIRRTAPRRTRGVPAEIPAALVLLDCQPARRFSDDASQEGAQLAFDCFRDALRRRPERRDVVTERAPHSEIPVAMLIGRRNTHVPGAYKVAVGGVNRPLHGLDCRRVRDVVNFDVDRIDGEHAREVCKSDTREIAG